MKLNLGCGKDYREGKEWVNLDISGDVDPDVVQDIEDGLPFEDNVFDHVLCSHILEHVEDLIYVVEEIYRVCKGGATVEIEVPYYKNSGAYRDPTHKRFFTRRTLDIFREEGLYDKRIDENIDYDTHAKFEFEEVRRLCSGKRSYVPRFILSLFDNFLWEMFWGIRFKLEVIK